MAENKKKTVKKGFITEEDVSTLLQRYSVTTIVALLQEVEAQVPAEKYDWNELVKKTKTGITNAREYQMLWRHLAYRAPLAELDDEEIEPLDDDSDLDCELEALPTVTPEVSAEAAACVKVLIASSMPINSALPNCSTIEAPLTINIPHRQSDRAPSVNLQPSRFVHGTNITVPVSVQKQPPPAVTPAKTAEGLDSGNLPTKKKRKLWSHAEDLELVAAVKKCGEGNWANILKEQLVKERTASQLSQRWNIIKKRKGNSSLGGKGTSSLGSKGSSSVGGSSKLSEAQLAARRAVSLALDMPLTGAPRKLEPGLHPTSMQRHEKLLPNKSLVNLKTQSTKSSDEMVKATAVAAGARIVTPSDAGLLKNTGKSLPSNVHYIRTGLATTLSTYSSVPPNDLKLQVGSHQKQNVASETTKSNSSLVIEVETKNLEGIVPNSVDAPKGFASRGGDGHVDMNVCENNTANLSVGVVGGDVDS